MENNRKLLFFDIGIKRGFRIQPPFFVYEFRAIKVHLS
jgi:hypothetical protein